METKEQRVQGLMLNIALLTWLVILPQRAALQKLVTLCRCGSDWRLDGTDRDVHAAGRRRKPFPVVLTLAISFSVARKGSPRM